MQAADLGAAAYPVHQFERIPDGTVRVKVGLQGFITTLLTGGFRDPWTCVICLKTSAPELDGLSPLEWARASQDAAVLTEYAKRLNAEHLR